MIQYRNIDFLDYEKLILFWEQEDINADNFHKQYNFDTYLKRNEGLSFIALHKNIIVGTIMSGHDSYRAYIQSLVVSKDFRKQDIASSLVKKCLSHLTCIGVKKCYVHVAVENNFAQEFWSTKEWNRRKDLEIFSFFN